MQFDYNGVRVTTRPGKPKTYICAEFGYNGERYHIPQKATIEEIRSDAAIIIDQLQSATDVMNRFFSMKLA